MLRVCALANMVRGPFLDRFTALERSLEKAGVPFFFYMESGKWDWNRKIHWEQEVVAAHPEDNYVFIDAFDFLFVGNREELEALVSANPLFFSCDCGDEPFPNPWLAPLYDKRRPRLTDWCWVNGCGPAGHGKDILEAITWGLENVPPAKMRECGRGDTDQLFWTKVYLDGWGELDQSCKLTQVLYDSRQPDRITPFLTHSGGRIVNTITGTQPQFIHATCQSWGVIPEELIP